MPAARICAMLCAFAGGARAMTGPLQLACPNCLAINRVPTARLGDRPTCGRCRAPLFPGEPFALAAAGFLLHI